jgi:Big-like domain-containing protein
MKRTLSLVLALVMVLGSFGAAFAVDAETTDELSAGAFLETVGVLEGDDDGNLMLDKTLLRRDMVILLSRLMGAEETAAEFPSESLAFEDITDAYYNGYIAWSVNNGLIEGHSETVFGFNENVTAQQYVTVLMRALGYEVADEDYAAVLETAAELGLCEGLEVENEDEILRGQMAVMTLNTLGTEMKDSEVTLAEDLGIELPEPEVTEATEVEKVYADNLKEIVVEFDGEVEKDSAELEVNYSLDDKDLEIDKAVLSEDMTEVVLTVVNKKNDTTKGMDNQEEYELTVRNIKTAEGKLNTQEIEFTPVDRAVPEVVAVEGLGNKAVKVTFTEPVKKVSSSDFKIDGKTFVGTIDQNKTGDNVVILKLYRKLSEGTHEIKIKGIEDFAKYLMVTTEMEFEVVEDNEAPAIESVDATLEYVTVTFTEPVQESTVRDGSYAYWKATESTSVKNKSIDVERISDDTYKFDFTKNALPGYSVYLYVEGVKDYSDNTIAKDSPVMVNAVIDQTRPEVVYVELDDDNEEITIKFNKAVSEKTVKDKDNFELLDEDEDEVRFRTPSVDGRTVTIELYKALEKGEYTLKLEGLQDITALKNTMMPYSATLEVGYAKAPIAEGYRVEGDNIYITFSRKMAIDGVYGVANPDNYFIKYGNKKTDANGDIVWEDIKTIGLPEDAEIQAYNDGKSVIISMPEEIDDESFKAKDNLESVTVQRVKDIDGNMLKGYSQSIGKSTEVFEVKEATLKDTKTIEIEFNRTIQRADQDEITLTKDGDSILDDARESNGNLVLELSEDIYSFAGLKLKTENDAFELFADETTELANAYEFDDNKAKDEVAPELAESNEDEFTATANQIDIKFTEEIATNAYDLYEGAFEVVRMEREDSNGNLVDEEELTPKVDYDVTVGGENNKVVTIHIINEEAFAGLDKAEFTVTLIKDSYVRDLHGNAAKAFTEIPTELVINTFN